MAPGSKATEEKEGEEGGKEAVFTRAEDKVGMEAHESKTEEDPLATRITELLSSACILLYSFATPSKHVNTHSSDRRPSIKAMHLLPGSATPCSCQSHHRHLSASVNPLSRRDTSHAHLNHILPSQITRSASVTCRAARLC